MNIAGAVAFVLLAFGAAPETAPPSPAQPRDQVVIRRQIIIRTIRVQPVRPVRPGPLAWREAGGPRCVPARAIAGAAQLRQKSVDLILRNRTRVRAWLGSACPALDYYVGFYITPGADGLICSDREAVRSRAGGECQIERFRILRPIIPAEGRLTSGEP